MKKHVSLLALSMLFIFGCSNESLDQTNDQLVAEKFMEIVTSSEVQAAIALKLLNGKSSQQKGPIEPDGAFIVNSVHGLVHIQFTDSKVFAFMGMGSQRIKEKNGIVNFDTKAKRTLCAVADPISRVVEYSNVCPIKPNGSLVAKGRLMPEDEILEIDFIGKLYAVNGGSKINAKDIKVNNAEVGYISPSSNNSLGDKIDCIGNSTASKKVSLKSEYVNGNNIELSYSVN